LEKAGRTALERGVQTESAVLQLLLDRVENNVRQLAPLVDGYVTAVAGRHEQWNILSMREAVRLVEGIGRSCILQQAAVERQMLSNLKVAEDVLDRIGSVGTVDGDVTWQATNQFSHEIREVKLPSIRLGDRVIKPNRDFSVPSPVVDAVTHLVGGTCTVFQRMNEQGDMLRVATTVRGRDGQRAISTYIPAIQPDNTPNPVVAQVLRGETFKGRAYVVDSWCITAYKPLRDASGKIIGMLYVGVKELEDSKLVEFLVGEHIGATGYSYILDSAGVVLAHPRPGFTGKHVVRDLKVPEFNQLLDHLEPGKVQRLDYTFEDRRKFVFSYYFKPWDWLICASGYWDDMAKVSAETYSQVLVNEMVSLYNASRMDIRGQPHFLYPQVRFLDKDGREVFKIVDGHPAQKLDDKSGSIWFKEACKTPKGQIFYARIEESENTGRAELRVGMPIYLDDKFQGLAILNFDWEITRDLIANNTYGESGYPYIINEEGVAVCHPKYKFSQKINLGDEKYGAISSIVNGKMLRGQSGFEHYTFEGVGKCMAFAPVNIGPYAYSLAVTTPLSEFAGLAHQIQDRAASERSGIAWVILLTMMGLGIAGAVAGRWLSHRVTDPIRRTVKMADAIAEGRLPAPLAAEGDEEIATLEASFNRMVETSRNIVAQTNALAQGEYAVTLQPRSEHDDLSHALIAMTESLRRFKAEDDRRNWLKTGMNELTERMLGDKEPVSLAQAILDYLAGYLGTQVGALFLIEGEILNMVATYAYTRQPGKTYQARLGEGLIGQCAKERKLMVLPSIPQDYLQIASGLGQTPPKALALVPLVRGDELAGVLELAALDCFQPHQLELLKACGEAAAAALLSSRARIQVAQLLEEARQQSEELQDQQVRLSKSNEELAARSLLLEKQATLLKDQQEELQQSNEELEEHTQALEKGQAEIRRKNEELELARTELTRKAEDLERASRYKSEFLANMSHELRTPLNSMLILSHLLASNKAGKLDEKQVEFAKTINKAGTDLLSLINDILDLSKIEAGQMEFHLEEVSLAEIAHTMDNLFKHSAQEKGLLFLCEIAPDAPATIITDNQRLQQVLKNLIGNALKFTETGSVKLCAAPPEKGSGMAVTLSVIDTGIGIPSEKQDLVFEAFKQADGSTNRRYGGTGLGLSISRELVHRLGGQLQLQSSVGVGTTFAFSLPADINLAGSPTKAFIPTGSPPSPLPPSDRSPARRPRQHSAAQPADRSEEEKVLAEAVETAIVPATPPASGSIPDDRASLHPGDRSMLIIEDDLAFARILVDLVRDRGFGAIWAGDGVTALRAAKDYVPTGIFLDVMLPGMDGWSVMQMLKDEPTTRHIPVHFISCLDRAMDGLRMGAVGYLTKPVTVDQLQEAIGRIQDATERRMRQLLVVEDVAMEATSIVELLAADDVEATTAATGAEAIRLLSENRFDCLVLDLGLSDMSGFDLLEHIRSKPELSRLPVIVHTGRDLSQEEEMKLRRYAESIIVKGAKSPERLLDEATLFLHLVENKMPEEKQRMLRLAHDTEALMEGKKVLLVDDDMRNVFSLTSVLEGFKMEVIPAVNGQEALNLLDKYPHVDLVLMDIMMPVMDGYEAIRAIRAQERFKSLPVIALTAKAMKGDRERCIQVGANDYLAKPVDVDRLLTLMRVWVTR
jgi:signal transduction histidine kinase/DNA-binding response OmpR family regulator/HAMP domain-containing protein